LTGKGIMPMSALVVMDFGSFGSFYLFRGNIPSRLTG